MSLLIAYVLGVLSGMAALMALCCMAIGKDREGEFDT